MPTDKVKASILLDKNVWQDFVGYARLIYRTTASKMIRKYIEEIVKQNSKERKS